MIYRYVYKDATVNMHGPGCNNSVHAGTCHCKSRLGNGRDPAHPRKFRMDDLGLNLFLTCEAVHGEAEPVFLDLAQFRLMCCFPGTFRSRSVSRSFSNIAQAKMKHAPELVQAVCLKNSLCNTPILSNGFSRVTFYQGFRATQGYSGESILAHYTPH